MRYEGQCGTCENSDCKNELERDISKYQKYFCDWYGCYYYPEDSCDHYKKHYVKQEGCYITTVLCNVLGYTDNCFVLNEMRNFRNDVMQKNQKYRDTLLEYDVLGPIIAKEIQENYDETQNKDMWVQFYKLYLSETANLVATKEYDAAVFKYKQMVGVLKQYFGIPDINLEALTSDYDFSQGGHGKYKALTPAIQTA